MSDIQDQIDAWNHRVDIMYGFYSGTSLLMNIVLFCACLYVNFIVLYSRKRRECFLISCLLFFLISATAGVPFFCEIIGFSTWSNWLY